ncbi:hypothetical protein TRSC58_06827 [Trypanosoma rangeli SC58]|uniref:Trans-sialidase C-terminal domain-containing protein n=1 Tax=Trypanosoma rangeli SC58 TaxID=429131 RepID=A0A061IWX0_TRYRA|nr:hypothetical protein TRSC58_06827 [Trypanosoma rangeli SC58]
MWPVNMWEYQNVHGVVDYAFTLVATVTIDEVPNGSAPLLGAGLEDNKNTTFAGLSYTTEKQWETVFNGITTTRSKITWEPGKAYQVALILQGNEGSVYVDGVLVGSSDTLPTLEARNCNIAHFHFGGGKDGSVTVKNVFLYNRPLSEEELKEVDDSNASWKRAADSSDGSGKSTADGSKASEQPAVDSSKASGKREGDSSTRADVFRVLILLLLGLWGFAALCWVEPGGGNVYGSTASSSVFPRALRSK